MIARILKFGESVVDINVNDKDGNVILFVKSEDKEEAKRVLVWLLEPREFIFDDIAYVGNVYVGASFVERYMFSVLELGKDYSAEWDEEKLVGIPQSKAEAELIVETEKEMEEE